MSCTTLSSIKSLTSVCIFFKNSQTLQAYNANNMAQIRQYYVMQNLYLAISIVAVQLCSRKSQLFVKFEISVE